jgi:hypothetical protein
VGLVLLSNHGDKRFVGLSHVCFEYATPEQAVEIPATDSSNASDSMITSTSASASTSTNTVGGEGVQYRCTSKIVSLLMPRASSGECAGGSAAGGAGGAGDGTFFNGQDGEETAAGAAESSSAQSSSAESSSTESHAAPSSPATSPDKKSGLKSGMSLGVECDAEAVGAPPVPPSPVASDDGYNSGWDEVESGSFM